MTARTSGQAPLVLVVDDEIELSRRVARLLERGGYRALACYSAGEALGLIAGGAIDVLVSDITMAEMDGLELLEAVMAPGRPPLAVVMMTGYDDTETAARAQELGAHGYLTKPFDRNALLISVSGALRRVRLESENADYRRYLEGALEERTEELESSRRMADVLINRTSDALLLVDTEQKVTYASAAVEEIFGFRRSEIIGHDVSAFLRPEDLADIAEAQIRAMKTRMPVTVEIQILRSDRSWVWCEAVGESHLDDPAIRGFVISLRNIEGRRRRHEELELQARHDQLTGLPNRYALTERLTRALAQADDPGDRSAVFFLDLDRLKVINDSLGHEIGDAILCVVAARLRSSVRPSDMVARFGGDEFVLVCSGLHDEAAAVDLARRIATRLSEPIPLDDRSFHVTAAIGFAMVSSRYHDTDALIRDADAAMYEAKSAGRASIREFDPTTHDHAVRRLEFESAVRSGAAESQWEIHYQPQCVLPSGDLVGFEALIRWRHPDLGLLFPDQFLSILEDAGLVAELDRFVLREACRFAALPHMAPLRISVNVSAGQLLSVDFADLVTSVLADAGLASDRLTIEITESAMINDLGIARTALTMLRQLGVGISVDDFGTGFSALSYLAELPVTEIKIDRSFVARSDAPTGRKLLEGIVSLANSMGLPCVAEGVENEDQLELLRRAGCHSFQGYLVSPGLGPDRLPTFLATHPAAEHWRTTTSTPPLPR